VIAHIKQTQIGKFVKCRLKIGSKHLDFSTSLHLCHGS